jgi:argininosuccinate lyase
MPSSVALWAVGYAAEIEDDAEGLRACIRRLDRCPLGSAAGYGTPGLEIDRERCRELLAFGEVHEPVTAVQLSRGKGESQVVFELSLLMQDLGRLAADVCLFATSEFALLRLPEVFTTGSSVMPQKRNPDIFELVRARSAQLPAELGMILAITQKMPSGYHRDLQLIKAPLFRAIDSTHETLAVMVHAMTGLHFDPERCADAARGPGMDATTRAWQLVATEKLSFREAYRRVAAELRASGLDS